MGGGFGEGGVQRAPWPAALGGSRVKPHHLFPCQPVQGCPSPQRREKIVTVLSVTSQQSQLTVPRHPFSPSLLLSFFHGHRILQWQPGHVAPGGRTTQSSCLAAGVAVGLAGGGCQEHSFRICPCASSSPRLSPPALTLLRGWNCPRRTGHALVGGRARCKGQGEVWRGGPC